METRRGDGRDADHPEGTLQTRLQEREAALRRSEARFRDVIERNADAIVVVDLAGAVRFANAAAERLFGTTRDALLGHPFGFPMVAGETTELDVMRPGQDSAVVEMRVVESEWEGARACIATLRDITERKRAEENARRLFREQAARAAAEAAAGRFRFLAESSAVLSEALDYDATLAALARLCTKELAHWAVVFCVRPDGRVGRFEVAHRSAEKAAAVAALRDAVIEPDAAHPVVEVMKSRTSLLVRRVEDGYLDRIAQDAAHGQVLRELGVSSFMMVPLVARGRSLGALGLVSSDPGRPFGDEDLRLAEELAFRAALVVDNARLFGEATEANRTKTDLLAVVSHDLRTPLNSIMGYAELLSLGIPEPLGPQSRENVERIGTGARHLLHLIDQLLAFARLDAGHQEMNARPTDVAALVREVGVVIEPLVHERGLHCRVRTPDSPVEVETDADRLSQLLTNLAANAVKFTSDGEVGLEVRQPGDGGVDIIVSDTGCGIAPDELSRIFEPFWQSESTRASSVKGVGLGLSVVHRLVRLLGGEIDVRSELGNGSTFTVRLPRTVVRVKGAAAIEVDAGARHRTPPPELLAGSRASR